jgi:hypothetical protein
MADPNAITTLSRFRKYSLNSQKKKKILHNNHNYSPTFNTLDMSTTVKVTKEEVPQPDGSIKMYVA